MKKYTILLLLAAFCCIAPATASHIAGGELRYQYTGTGNVYKVYLVLYRDCSGVTLANTETVQISSASCSQNINLSVPTISDDTLDPFIYCPGTVSSCISSSSVYPGYIRRVYSANVTLAACNDWKFSYYNCCRSASLNNVTNPAATGMYLEAFLDNSAAINTNAYTPNPLPFLTSTSYVTTHPIPAADPEGDSVVTEFITPQGTSSTGGNLAYNAGYSVTSPLGSTGVATINNANQTIKLKGAATGRYVLATRIKEYRNGQLVGYSSRDWAVAAYPAAAPLTIPLAAATNTQAVSTCPGQTHTITLTYNDSTATDSVYTSMSAPVIPGFSFTATAAPGIGSGSVTITWTTPAAYNPANLPYFFINVFARDNACPRGAAMYTVAVYGGQCAADSVWPGDANADFTVNMYDPLAIAIAYGQTGPARTGASITWTPQACSSWTNSFLNGSNMKHADCNGDGTVNSMDLAAISANYGLTHPKNGNNNQARVAGLPDLYLDVTGIVFKPGSTVSIPVKLGSNTANMNNLYGMATTLRIDGLNLTTAPSIAYPSSWMGTAANTLSFVKNTSNNRIDWVYARNDHQNVSGQGAIATLNFTVPPNAALGQVFHIFFENTKLIDKNGTEITAYNTINDTSVVQFAAGVQPVTQLLLLAAVVPNPSTGYASLHLATGHTANLAIRICDMAGRIIWQKTVATAAGTSDINLPAASVSAGIYTIQVQDESTHDIQVIRWTRN